ncbi:MAG TPA: lysyl oxidase family protein [Candidatus Limnocylindria bacterium]|jgi:hypothetical protein|nr:lysyl oxidase family protein [Candidatus Limnocylindria bacterium]
MVEKLAQLKPLKGRHRTYKYYGEENGLRHHDFLTDYEVMTDPDELEDTEGTSHRRHAHLIFSNCVANIGEGIMLLAITKTARRGRAKVEQLIEDDAKPREQWRRRPAGSAIFDDNPDHNHWHFANFLQYRLLSVKTGEEVKEGLKQSFCLEDVAKLDRSVGRRLFARCPNLRMKTGQMGITPGWGDVYWSGVQEQYIEVKNLPAGAYWLECVVDPKNRLTVKSRRQNTTRVKIRL